jgi:glutamyl-tRNA reductase
LLVAFILEKSNATDLLIAVFNTSSAALIASCAAIFASAVVAVAATSSGQTLLVLDDIENLMKARRNRPLLLIDLSVPRNIDPAASQLENVTLYNIDDLEALVRQGAQARARELATCHQIIETHVTALIKKLESERERMTRTDLFRRSLEATRDISYPLPTTSGLVAQPS